ncbi:MAG TPA: hypothetical protein VIY48_00480 [Candidatus Paceibacterota bacterium]
MSDLRHPDMRERKQITVKMTEQFAKDLNLLFASYGLTDLSYVVRESVAAQAEYVRERMTAQQKVVHDPDCEKTYHAPGDCGPIPY